VILYIAVSLDGYIARLNGDVDWLNDFENGQDYGYKSFLESIDALLIGRKTYEQILTFGDWPYSSKPSWVFSHRKFENKNPEISITSQPPESLLSKFEKKGFNQVWLVGGANLLDYFIKKNLISDYILSIMPTILGQGIPLFTEQHIERKLEIAAIKDYPNGVVQVHYKSMNPGIASG
jgi:dihydrofolate reductase